jgi:hypothetical protein
MRRTQETFDPFVGGEVEMRRDGRPVWRCEVRQFFVSQYGLLAIVTWLAINSGENGTESWKKFQHPEVTVLFWNYSRPELIGPGERGGERLILRHNTLNQVILLHPPDGERLDPIIVGPIKSTFIQHADPPMFM